MGNGCAQGQSKESESELKGGKNAPLPRDGQTQGVQPKGPLTAEQTAQVIGGANPNLNTGAQYQSQGQLNGQNQQNGQIQSNNQGQNYSARPGYNPNDVFSYSFPSKGQNSAALGASQTMGTFTAGQPAQPVYATAAGVPTQQSSFTTSQPGATYGNTQFGNTGTGYYTSPGGVSNIQTNPYNPITYGTNTNAPKTVSYMQPTGPTTYTAAPNPTTVSSFVPGTVSNGATYRPATNGQTVYTTQNDWAANKSVAPKVTSTLSNPLQSNIQSSYQPQNGAIQDPHCYTVKGQSGFNIHVASHGHGHADQHFQK